MVTVLYVRIDGFDQQPCTRAYDQWAATDIEIRAFLSVMARLIEQEFTRLWNEIESEPGDPDGPEVPDVFHQRVEGGVWPDDHHWMLLAATVKDAVTAYEVYLEQAFDEVLAHHGSDDVFKKRSPDKGPPWPKLEEVYKRYLELTIEPGAVGEIRGLRHVLTHQRGLWRTPEQEERFQRLAGPEGGRSWRVPLTTEMVVDLCDVLAATVREFEPVLWRYSWGGERVATLPPTSGDDKAHPA